jgi:predicted alpha/beta hydrolase family esterase
MTEKKAILIHGAYGSPDENWFPWLAKNLKDRGVNVVVPVFPTPKDQNPTSWLAAFEVQGCSLDHNTVLVGHSLGVAFIFRLLERSTEPVRGTFLVSAFLGALGLPDFDPINAPFFEAPFDWQKIRGNAGIVRVYNGDNDPYVPLQKGYEIARNLGTDLTIIENGGHINKSAGYDKFERLLNELSDLIGWR